MLDRDMAERFDDVWVEADETWDKTKVQARAVSKIHGEMPKKRRSKKRTFVVLAAAIIAIMGTFSFGAERDWDIRFAELIGVGDVMTDLPGGYKEIDRTVAFDDVQLTVSQAIGDKNSQWIQMDSNLSWEGGEAAWEIFESIDVHVYENDDIITGGYSVEAFNCNGNLSFIIYMIGYHHINEADMEMTAVLQSGERMKISWSNYYAANAEVYHPLKKTTLREEGRTERTCVITTIEVTPVSLNLNAWTNPFAEDFDAQTAAHLSVDAVILTDGTVVQVDGFDVSGFKTTGQMDCFLSLSDIADGSQIAGIMIGGVEIKL